MLSKHSYFIILYFLIALAFSLFFVGKDNFWFHNTNWLYGSGDLTNAQLSWKFFLNDIWRFPLGKNPNYGLEIANSIIFTDNIPLLAITFKIFKQLINQNFQYFSLWVFISFFLQLFFSYLLINNITKDKLYSFLSSFLFLLIPFLLYRMTHHFSLGGQWLILYSIYVAYFVEENRKVKHWYFLIFLSLLVHLYFTLMILIIYFFDVLDHCIKNKKFKKKFFQFISVISFLLFIMFIIGYFESAPINAVSSGYGLFKIDLLSFLDPKIDGDQSSWSIFLKDLPGTHFEGYTYIGLGNIILILFSLLIFLNNKFKRRLYTNNIFFFRIKNLSLIVLFLWALTSNISILGNEILNPTLPNYLFGLLSIFSSTGRFSWPLIYVLIFFATIIIYKNFSKFYSILFIIIFIFIQALDISVGLKNNVFSNKIVNQREYEDPIWKYIDENFDNLRTTYLFHNYGSIFSNASLPISKMDSIKTDIILNAAMDREKAASVRYNLANKIKNYRLDPNTAYIIDNLEHLKQLKFQLLEKNYGFFNRDNFWIILPGKKELMTKSDVKKLEKINFDKINLNEKYNLNFKDNFLGFGWTHNFENKGVWSEGKNAFLFFELSENNKKDYELEISYSPYSKNKKENYDLSIYLNNIFHKKIKIIDHDVIKIPIKYSLNNKNKFIINFEFDGLVSPYDLFESPDARKLGILLNSIILKG